MSIQQHFLPLFYLKHFTDPMTPKGQEPYVWFFQNLEWKRKAPKNIACLPDFYGIKNPDGTVNQLFETKLQFVEDKVAPILASLGQREPIVLTGAERVFLSYFLVSMQHRTPGFLNAWADEIERFAKWQYRMVFQTFDNDPDKFEAFKKSLQTEGASTRYENLAMSEVSPDKFERWRVRPVTAFSLSELMKTWEYLAGLIYSMNWVMLILEKPHFVTSEAPLVSIRPLKAGGWMNCPFGTLNVDVSLPLTSRHVLMCSWRGSESYKVMMPSERDINTVNLRTINNAADQVFENWNPIEVIAANREFPMAAEVDRVANERRSKRAKFSN